MGSAGSGKELMLAGIVYQTITSHDPKEVNFYILDFGAETLRMFNNAPHVGEVILSTDAEKIANLFKMVNQIIDERKKIFVDYNGSYDFYINHGGKQIPMIVIMINNVEAFLETYNEYLEYDGEVVEAMFFSTSVGKTENSEEVFSSAKPYLRSVDSYWDSISPAYEVNYTFITFL